MKNEEHKMIKMINKAGHLTEGARKAFKGAHIAGGADEMIMIPGGYGNTSLWNRLHVLASDMDIALYNFNEDAYVYVDWARKALEGMSKTASDEFFSMVRA